MSIMEKPCRIKITNENNQYQLKKELSGIYQGLNKLEWYFQQDYRREINLKNEEKNKLDMFDKKKNKKKEYKKRKRQKERMQQSIYFCSKDQAKGQLAAIVRDIYLHDTNFTKSQQRINICLSHMENSEKFYELLDILIRTNIDDLQRAIQQQAHTLVQSLNISQADDLCFDMISIICQQYQALKQSSQQIRKIVKAYNYMQSQFEDVSPSFRTYDQLQKESLTYLIRTSDILKKIIRDGQRIAQQNFVQIDKQIAQLISLNKFLQQQQFYPYQHSESTSIQQEEDDKNIGKKKKKKKVKNYQFKSEFENVLSRLDNLILDDSRIRCCISQEWVLKLQNDIKKNFNKK